MRVVAILLVVAMAVSLPVSVHAAGHCHHDDESALDSAPPSPCHEAGGAHGVLSSTRAHHDAPEPTGQEGPSTTCQCFCHSPVVTLGLRSAPVRTIAEALSMAPPDDGLAGFPLLLERPPRA